MELNGAQQKELNDALRSAFTRDRLQRLLRYRLNRKLDDITGGGTYPQVVQDVIELAVAENWWPDLVAQAREENPGNEKLSAFAESVAVASAPTVLAASPGEQTIRASNTLLHPAEWRERLRVNEFRVCLVDAPRGAGTGFLVAGDVVMTNEHVIRGVQAAGDITLWFDYKRDAVAGRIGPAVGARLAREWCVHVSPESQADFEPDPASRMPREHELDFALLRLDESIGDQLVGAPQAGEHRGWIELPHAPPHLSAGDSLHILQHAGGHELRLGIETDSVIGFNGNATRIRHRTNTLPGSSGSPCFDRDWALARIPKQRIGTWLGAGRVLGARQANSKCRWRSFHQGICVSGRSAVRMMGL